jgi:hypothetical protein
MRSFKDLQVHWPVSTEKLTVREETEMNQNFEFLDGKLVRRVIAEQMGVKHDLLMQTLRRYRNQLEKSGITREHLTEDSNGSSVGETSQEVQ